MKEQITYDIFDKVDIRVGTVISVKKNEKARKPSLVVEVDFGEEIGIKQSSAQITHYYNEENLKGKQVIGVCNFAEKNIAGVVSQVLILGSIDKEGKVILEAELFSLDGSQRFYEKKSAQVGKAKELGKEVGHILKTKSKNTYKK